jgi:enoyl-CoA hydratase
MRPSDYTSIKFEGPDEFGVVSLTLNRPEVGNAIDEAMHHEIVDVAHILRNPKDIGAVLLTGAGSIFCAGADIRILDRLATDDDHRTWFLDFSVHLVSDWLSIRPPVVTAINGHAMGLGATLALLGDIVYMSDTAKIADTHVKAGVVAGDGGALLWPALMGPNRAKEFLMTGDALDGPTACSLGLVNHVLPKDEMLDTATAMARRLAQGPRHAIAWTKQSVNVGLLRDAASALRLSISLEARSMAQPDMLEGAAAFLAKRKPSWSSAAVV